MQTINSMRSVGKRELRVRGNGHVGGVYGEWLPQMGSTLSRGDRVGVGGKIWGWGGGGVRGGTHRWHVGGSEIRTRWVLNFTHLLILLTACRS